jgi:LPS export ABC transporter protein LptC
VIPGKTKAGILLLTGLVAFSYWASRGRNDDTEGPIVGLDTQLDYALQDFEYWFYDAQGNPSANLKAPELTNHAINGISEVNNPVFTVIDRGISWRIVAESATVTADKENIVLSGDVWIRRPAMISGEALSINTSELTIEVSPKLASSDRPVRMTEGDDIMEATGFRVNMGSNRFQLLNQVKLTYDVN